MSKRRKGRIVEQLAAEAQTSVHKARLAIELVIHGDAELVNAVCSGQLRLSQAVAVIRQSREIKRRSRELTFEEIVERSFKRFLSKWPPEQRGEVMSIVDLMPPVSVLFPPPKRKGEKNSVLRTTPKQGRKKALSEAKRNLCRGVGRSVHRGGATASQ